MADLNKSFGNRQVDSAEREERIRQVFDSVAARYDLMNDAMSFGIHRLWKLKFAKMVNAGTNQTIIDLAGGTGDIAIKLNRKDNFITIIDPSLAMMRAGLQRHSISCISAPAESLPIADNSIDKLTIAFGIRNVTHLETALNEITRVLKPGGQCWILEFSTPQRWLKPVYDLYSFWVIPTLGAWVAQQPAAYQYLIESIRKFPDQKAMQKHLKNAGLEKVNYRNLSFGIACIHSSNKPLKFFPAQSTNSK